MAKYAPFKTTTIRTQIHQLDLPPEPEEVDRPRPLRVSTRGRDAAGSCGGAYGDSAGADVNEVGAADCSPLSDELQIGQLAPFASCGERLIMQLGQRDRLIFFALRIVDQHVDVDSPPD